MKWNVFFLILLFNVNSLFAHDATSSKTLEVIIPTENIPGTLSLLKVKDIDVAGVDYKKGEVVVILDDKEFEEINDHFKDVKVLRVVGNTLALHFLILLLFGTNSRRIGPSLTSLFRGAGTP